MPFLGLFIAVVCLFTFFRKRSNRSQENVTDRFWKRESIANNTRLQDLSGLPYITIPFDKFPIGMYENDLLKNYAPITEKIVVEQVTIPYETITKEATGSGDETRNKVVQNGQDGLKEITYKIKYQNETEIEKTVLSEVVIKEPVNKIVQIQKVTSRASTTSRSTAVSYGGGKWSYSASDMDLLCAITAQECGSSYSGALAVITTACNRAESAKWKSRGLDPLSQYKAKGQFCYSIDSHWKRKLNGNYSSAVKQAVTDALNGKRNHSYLSFRAAGTHSGELIGGNVYF